MLGEIIGEIKRNRITPYNRYLTDRNKINGLRKKSAHTGLLGKSEGGGHRGRWAQRDGSLVSWAQRDGSLVSN